MSDGTENDGRLVVERPGGRDALQHDERSRVNRRRFLIGAGSAAGGAAATAFALPGALGQEATPAAGPGTPGEAIATVASTNPEQGDHLEHTPGPPTNPGFTAFVPFQAAIIEAAAARLIPTDELGPGATEAGVVYFIDRQLASESGYRGPQYGLGPFVPGEPTQGDQSALEMRARFRLGIQGMEDYAQQVYQTPFVQLAPKEQDRILSDMEQGIPETFGGATIQSAPFTQSAAGTEAIEQAAEAGIGATAFFNLLLSYTFAGFFADPVQGGNRDMVGWKLIGFPGAHIGYPEEILKYGEPFQGEYISLGQYQQQMSGGS